MLQNREFNQIYKMKKTVVFLCEGKNHIKFFTNMENAFQKLGYACVYFVLDFSIYLQLKEKTLNKIILAKKKDYSCNTEEVFCAKDYIEGVISENDAKNIYKSVWYYCDRFCKESQINLIIASQGILTAEIAIKNFAKTNKIPILFFELANIPGKTFWDIEGSNAKSYLYNHIEILDDYTVDKDEYLNWKTEYIKSNFKQHLVKQATGLKHFNYLYGLIGRFNFLFTGLSLYKFDILTKMKYFIKSRTIKIKYDEVDISKEKYIFFPMQVASDSQIILNSDIGLFDALKYSIKKAEVDNLNLVVKLHPAERDIDVIYTILKLREKYKFNIVDNNTFEVIANAQKVITINSTVALEAMILDMPVEILGRSFYKFFNKERTKNYILGYLEDIDFFSSEKFTVEQVKKLINRCKR